MFHPRKLIAAAALAAATVFGVPAQQAQAATIANAQTAVIGEDYTFNTVVATQNSTPIGPVKYEFTFSPVAGGANAVLTATFSYLQLSGGLTGGYITWGNGATSTLTQALVAGTVGTLTASIPLSAAGPSRTLTVGFQSQTGTTILGGGVTVAEDKTVSTIPLPASGVLLLAGLGAIGLLGRHRATKLAA